MATKVNYEMKVVNTPKGLTKYSSVGMNSTKSGSLKNGSTLHVDRIDTDISGIWYRDASNLKWILGKSSSGATHLKIISKSSGPTSINNVNRAVSSRSVSVTNFGNVGRGETVTNQENTQQVKGASSIKKITKNTTPRKASNANISRSVESDVVVQNSANYPPVDHVDERTGQIWYNWSINLNKLKSSIDIVKKNLNVPSSYNRMELANLSHTKFNRYKIEYGDYKLKPTLSYVAFVRPDLNLFDENRNILPQIENDPQLYYIWKNNPSIMRQLCLDYATKDKFIPLLTNQVTALDALDESLDTTEVGETFRGHKLQYARGNVRSMTAGTVSVKFPETNDLSVTQMMQTWCAYENGVYKGILIPKQDYCTYKILDYAVDIYHFLMDRDMTIRFWTCYYGAFPTNVNKSIFSYDMGSDSGGADVNVTFAYFHKLDWDIRSLISFNNLSGAVSNQTKFMADTDPSVCMGGGSTWAGAPFVQLEKAWNGTDTVDQLKFRFRP